MLFYDDVWRAEFVLSAIIWNNHQLYAQNNPNLSTRRKIVKKSTKKRVSSYFRSLQDYMQLHYMVSFYFIIVLVSYFPMQKKMNCWMMLCSWHSIMPLRILRCFCIKYHLYLSMTLSFHTFLLVTEYLFHYDSNHNYIKLPSDFY